MAEFAIKKEKIGGMLTWQLWPVCAQLTMTTMERAVTRKVSGAQISNKASSKLLPSKHPKICNVHPFTHYWLTVYVRLQTTMKMTGLRVMMWTESGALTLNKVSSKRSPSILRAVDARSYCRTREKCTVRFNTVALPVSFYCSAKGRGPWQQLFLPLPKIMDVVGIFFVGKFSSKNATLSATKLKFRAPPAISITHDAAD